VLEGLGRRHAARPRGRMRAGGGGRPAAVHAADVPSWAS
jgi:hypothetical protein